MQKIIIETLFKKQKCKKICQITLNQPQQYKFYNEYGISDNTRVFMNNLKFSKKIGQVTIGVIRPQIGTYQKQFIQDQNDDPEESEYEMEEENYIKQIGSAYIQFYPRDQVTQKMMYDIKLVYSMQNKEMNQLIRYDVSQAESQIFTYTTRGEYPLEKTLNIFQSQKNEDSVSLNYQQQNLNNYEDKTEIQIDLKKQEFVTIQSVLQSINPLFFGWGYELKAFDVEQDQQ